MKKAVALLLSVIIIFSTGGGLDFLTAAENSIEYSLSQEESSSTAGEETENSAVESSSDSADPGTESSIDEHNETSLEENESLAADETLTLETEVEAETGETVSMTAAFVGATSTLVTVDEQGTGNYRTIQEALDAVSNGGEIRVYPGVYVVPFSVSGGDTIATKKTNVTIVGVEANGDPISGTPKATIIYADSNVAGAVENQVTFEDLNLESYSDSIASGVISAAPKVPGTFANLQAAIDAAAPYGVINVTGPLVQATVLDINKPVTIIGTGTAKITLSVAASQINVSSANVGMHYLPLACTTTAAGPTGAFLNVTASGFNMVSGSIVGTSTKVSNYILLDAEDLRLDRYDFSGLRAGIPAIASSLDCKISVKDTNFNLGTTGAVAISSTGAGAELDIVDSKFIFAHTNLAGIKADNADAVMIDGCLFDYTTNAAIGDSVATTGVESLTVQSSTFQTMAAKKAINHIISTGDSAVLVDGSTFTIKSASPAVGTTNYCVKLDGADSFAMTNTDISIAANYNTAVSVVGTPDVLFDGVLLDVAAASQNNGILVDNSANGITVNNCDFNYRAAGTAALRSYAFMAANAPALTVTDTTVKTDGNYITGMQAANIPAVTFTNTTHEIVKGGASEGVTIENATGNITFTSGAILCTGSATNTNENKGIKVVSAKKIGFTNTIFAVAGNYSYGLDTTDAEDISIQGNPAVNTFTVGGTRSMGTNIRGNSVVTIKDCHTEVDGSESKGIVATGSEKVTLERCDLTAKLKTGSKTVTAASIDAKIVSYTDGALAISNTASKALEIKNASTSVTIKNVTAVISEPKNNYALNIVNSQNIDITEFTGEIAPAATYSSLILMTDSSFAHIYGCEFTVQSLQSSGVGSSSTVPLSSYIPQSVSRNVLGHDITIEDNMFYLDGTTDGTIGITASINNNLLIQDNSFICGTAFSAIAIGYGTGHVVQNNKIFANGYVLRGIISDGMNDRDPWVDDDNNGLPESARTHFQNNEFTGNFGNAFYICNNGDIVQNHDLTNTNCTIQIMVAFCLDVDIRNNSFAATPDVTQTVIRAYNSTINSVDSNTFQFAPNAIGPNRQVLAVEGTLQPVTGWIDSANGSTPRDPSVKKFTDSVNFTKSGPTTLNTINGRKPYEIVNAETETSEYQYILKLSSVPVVLEAEKEVIGAALGDNKFDFAVKADGVIVSTAKFDLNGNLEYSPPYTGVDENGDPEYAPITAQNNAAGKIVFPAITFESAGVYTFDIVEISPDYANWISDKTIKTVTVTVAYDADNHLIATIDYPYPAGSTKLTKTFAVEYDGRDDLITTVNYPEGGVVFTNIYTPEAIQVPLVARKITTNAPLGNNVFDFIVVDKNGTTVATAKNDALGNIAFPSLSFSATGVYNYKVKEVAVQSTSWTTDPTIFDVSVTITQNQQNELLYQVSYPAGGVVFNNRYAPTSIQVTLVAQKNVTGGTLGNYKFDFALRDSDNNTVATTQNDAAGKITFPALTYTDAGTHTYTIIETTTDYGNWTTDRSVKNVTVTITRNASEQLQAAITYPQDGAVFTNHYTPSPIYVALTAEKTTTGADLGNNVFDFVVADKNGTTVCTAKNDADGNIDFPDIKYSNVGVYQYKIREQRVSAKHWQYDTTVFTVTVTVTQNSENRLVAQIEYPKRGVVFNNVFVPTAVEVVLKATKKAIGGELIDGQFAFAVIEDGTTIVTGTNKASGDISFPAISYTEPGTHTYRIVETSESNAEWKTDKTEHTVTVDVTQKDDGRLLATVSYPKSGIVFTNTRLAAPEVGEDTVVDKGGISVFISKQLSDDDGNLIGDGKKFAVRIYDENRNLIKRVILSANQDEVEIQGLKDDKVYYLVEEGGAYTLEGFSITGVGSTNKDVLGFKIPKIDDRSSYAMSIVVYNLVKPAALMEISDEDVPLMPYTPPLFNVDIMEVPLAQLPVTGRGMNTIFLIGLIAVSAVVLTAALLGKRWQN